MNLNSLKEMAEQVEDSSAFTVMDAQNNLYFVKGDNPLCIYHYPKTGIYLYASTEEILKKALDALRLPLESRRKSIYPAESFCRLTVRGISRETVFVQITCKIPIMVLALGFGSVAEMMASPLRITMERITSKN